MSTEKLQQKVIINGDIVLKTGTHIGGTNSQMGIGGADKLVIRNPLNRMPIIPGSSLKGKMRGLLELLLGKYDQEKLGEVGNDPEITKLFGSSAKDNSHPSRLIVRDAVLKPEKIKEGDWDNTDMYYAEAKTEVSINRLTSRANPRTFERVPAGAVFEFEMVVNVVSTDKQVDEVREDLLNLLARGMELLQDDYIGGQGSRGYGQIEFENLTFKVKDFHNREVDIDEVKKHFENLIKPKSKNEV